MIVFQASPVMLLMRTSMDISKVAKLALALSSLPYLTLAKNCMPRTEKVKSTKNIMAMILAIFGKDATRAMKIVLTPLLLTTSFARTMTRKILNPFADSDSPPEFMKYSVMYGIMMNYGFLHVE